MHMDEDAFPVLDKVHVNGEYTVPFYRFMKQKQPVAEGGVLEPIQKIRGEIPQGELSWNYEKFFIDENGDVIKRVSHAIDVISLEEWIKEQLASE